MSYKIHIYIIYLESALAEVHVVHACHLPKNHLSDHRSNSLIRGFSTPTNFCANSPDSEKSILLIPAADAAAHCAINIAVNANWNLEQTLRFVLTVQGDSQRAWRRRAALS